MCKKKGTVATNATYHIGLTFTSSQSREVLVHVVRLIVLYVIRSILVLAKQKSRRVRLIEVEVVEARSGSSDRHRIAVKAAEVASV